MIPLNIELMGDQSKMTDGGSVALIKHLNHEIVTRDVAINKELQLVQKIRGNRRFYPPPNQRPKRKNCNDCHRRVRKALSRPQHSLPQQIVNTCTFTACLGSTTRRDVTAPQRSARPAPARGTTNNCSPCPGQCSQRFLPAASLVAASHVSLNSAVTPSIVLVIDFERNVLVEKRVQGFGPHTRLNLKNPFFVSVQDINKSNEKVA